ncbi:MAG TPA: hypothetical protein VNS08_16525 [Ureibacillus sp.]|nr:hypothetical protein [Ureibacillus sp.]
MRKRPLDLDTNIINPNAVVKVTTMNHIVEVQYMDKSNSESFIQKLDADRYVDKRTGEIHEFQHTENRSQGENSLRKTFNRLRELINANFTGKANELFITLTYRGDLQTNDTKRIYKDFEKFIKRLRYNFKDKSTIDYINVLEPHASGNYHMHVLMRFNDLSKVFIPNAELAEIWSNGFVKIQSLKDVDNIGAYVSAYLSDIEVDINSPHALAEEKEVNGEKKKFVKGARLVFYKTGVNIYRKSKGIQEPKKEKMTYFEVQKKVGFASPNFKYGIELFDDDKDFRNAIIKEQYNLKRP